MSNKALTRDELRVHLMQLADEVDQKMKGDIAMSKRHKHADLIHAFAEGAEEVREQAAIKVPTVVWDKLKDVNTVTDLIKALKVAEEEE